MTRRLGVGVTIVAFVTLAGCAESFGDKLREHRNCIGDARIEPEKVDLCLRNTNGHRDRMNLCLNDEMVAESEIQRLDECVEAYRDRK